MDSTPDAATGAVESDLRRPLDEHNQLKRLLGRFYYAVTLLLLVGGFWLRIAFHDAHTVVGGVLADVGTFTALVVSLHFLYEHLVKREERQVLVFELNEAVAGNSAALTKRIEQLAAVGMLGRVTVCDTRDGIYAEIVSAMRRSIMTARGHKRLLTAPIHGHDEKRCTEVEDTNKAFRAFMREMRVHKIQNMGGEGDLQRG